MEGKAGPKRIQRKRTKGWKMPEGAVYVGRPTKWGNPFKIGERYRRQSSPGGHVKSFFSCAPGYETPAFVLCADATIAVEWFKWWRSGEQIQQDIRRELRGKDLACWCPLDQPCHADVLLEIANAD